MDNIAVTLPEVRNSVFERAGNLDPQRVMLRQNNQGTIYLDTISQVLSVDSNKVDITLSSGIRAGVLANGIRRLAPRTFGITWYIPNINPRNNLLRFYSSTSGVMHPVLIPVGYYFTPADLVTAILVALNASSGVSFLTFTATAIGSGYINNKYEFSSSGGEFYFDPTCPAVTRGGTVWAPTVSSTLSTSHDTGFMNLRYTNYVNVMSSALTKYSKISASSNEVNSNGDLLARIIIDDPSSFDKTDNPLSLPYGLITENISNDLGTNWFNYDATQSISLIDVRLLDQYGELLYVDDQNGFDWFLFVSTQGA